MWNCLEIAGCPTHVACSSRDVSGLKLDDVARGLKPEEWALVPLGRIGDLLWSTLPRPVARFVAPPTDYAVCIIPRDAVGDDLELWSRFVGTPRPEARIAEPQGDDTNAPLPELAPRIGRRVPDWVRTAFRNWAPPEVASTVDAQAFRAGILQLWDELVLSHEQSQAIEGEGRHVAGDYWHGIMHRREPDYGNSKYWFRRVGRHPVFQELAPLAAEVLSESEAGEASSWNQRLTGHAWDPMVFVELCQQVARDQQSPLGVAARQIQFIEMLLLLNSTWHDAIDE